MDMTFSLLRRQTILAAAVLPFFALANSPQLSSHVTAAPRTSAACTYPTYPPATTPGFPGWGVEVASIDNVGVYSNGGDTCNAKTSTKYGAQYQCVELIQRYYAIKWHYPNIWPNIGTAADLWSSALPTTTSGTGQIVRYDNTAANMAANPPVRGDALVWTGGSGGSGHVALVTSVTNHKVYFVDQNFVPYGQDALPIVKGVIQNSGSDIYDPSAADLILQGWLHSPLNTTQTLPSSIVHFEVKEPGVGVGTGQHPPLPPTTRTFQMLVTNSSQKTWLRSGSATWNSTTGYWTGSVSFGTSLPPDHYMVQVRMDQTANQQHASAWVPGGMPSDTFGTISTQYEIEKVATYLPQPSLAVSTSAGLFPSESWVELITGDINNDGAINILDYNILIGCFNGISSSCTAEQYAASDIDEDGTVDSSDYNLWLDEENCYEYNKCYQV
jgi:hypothetical protein